LIHLVLLETFEVEREIKIITYVTAEEKYQIAKKAEARA
jgi:hypothetical protein